MPTPKLAPSQRRNRSSTAAEAISNGKRATAGAKVGRPLTYHPDLCDIAVALGNKGQTFSEIATAFNISRETLYAWQREFPAFSDALARARSGMQAWWEAHGRKNLKAKHYQANTARIILGANLEDYRERPKPISSELVDFLTAVVEAAGERKTKAIPAPGDQAKAIEPLDVVTGRTNRDR